MSDPATKGARQRLKGRGAVSSPPGRFARRLVEPEPGPPDDGAAPRVATVIAPEVARTVITRNRSPDVPFDRSINPYRGCEHGCVYCYARPSHAWLDLSPGLDFETRIFYKRDAAALLEAELARPDYRCAPIALGANTDPYQPAERRLRVTRELLEVLSRFSHPVTIVTKSALVERDIDIIASMAQRRLAAVSVSVTTLDDETKRTLEPRTASPRRRLETIRRLSAAGIPVAVLVAPVIPWITEHELERILEEAAAAGAERAGYILLRLPHELKAVFRDWLDTHHPLRAAHVMSAIRQARGGRDYDARFGHRQRGTGSFADLLEQRFRVACRRLGLGHGEAVSLDTSRFRRPPATGDQLSLLP